MGFGVIYCLYYVEEVKRDCCTKDNIIDVEKPKKMGLILDWFNFKGLKSVLTVLTRKRKDKKRSMLYLCYLLLFFGMGPFFGKWTLYYYCSCNLLYSEPFQGKLQSTIFIPDTNSILAKLNSVYFQRHVQYSE